MEWKKGMDEMLADELEEQIIDYLKAGFLSDEEILEYCEEYPAVCSVSNPMPRCLQRGY